MLYISKTFERDASLTICAISLLTVCVITLLMQFVSIVRSTHTALLQCIVTICDYSRNCYFRLSLGAAKTSLKQQVVCEMRVTKTCSCKGNTFSPKF